MASFWSSLSNPPIQPISGASRYCALIDAAQVERFSRTIKSKNLLGLGRVALFGEAIAPDRYDATPHLFEIEEPSNYATFVRQLSKIEATQGAITCLRSPLELPELATRLKRRLDAKLPDDVDCVNRFFDGRIAPHLHACLSDEQRAVFFSVAEQWVVVGHDYEWQPLDCHFTVDDHFSGPLVFNTKQEAYLIDRCYPYALIEHFERTDPELLDTVEPNRRYQFFQKAIEAGESYKIEGSSDITLFCTLSLTRGAGFHEESPWQEKLQAVRAGTATLQQILKSFHD
jgi:hypothetical protein